MTVEDGVVFVILTGLALFDIKKKQVCLTILLPLGAVALFWRLFQGTPVPELLSGLLPGTGSLLLSYVTKESIGRGDGWVLCILGLFCGWKITLAVFCTALFFAAVWAMVLLVWKKAGRKTELPFLPCISLGFLFCVVL